jgi:hypothetical protein
MPQVNVSKQGLFTLIIILGAGLLVYDFIANPSVIYFKIAGLIILMFGLYKSTQQWTSDNKAESEQENNAEIDVDFDEDASFDEDNLDKNGK